MGKNPPKPGQKSSPASSSNKSKSKSSSSTSEESAAPNPSPSKNGSKKSESGQEPPIKKAKLESKSDSPSTSSNIPPVLEELGGRSSRRVQILKNSEPTGPICAVCKVEQKDDSEELKQCSKCTGKYHITLCLRYKDEFAENITKNENWKCPRCVVCDACKKFISDPSNIECTGCTKAWHGSCSKRGYCPLNEWDSPWYCYKCCKSRNFKLGRDTAITHQVPSLWPKHKKKNREIVFGDKTNEELKAMVNRRVSLYDTLKVEAGLAEEKADGTSKQETGTSTDANSSAGTSSSSKSKKKDKKKKKSAANTSATTSEEIQIQEIIQFALDEDKQLYEKAKNDAYPPVDHGPPPTEKEQWLHFGTGTACKAIYESEYKAPLQNARHLYSCKFCLHTTNQVEDFLFHGSHCLARHPPGNEIYRHEVDGLSFFEVDGADQKKYCQDLCLLAKLFISSKTLYTEVETFIFYVLCEITPEGFVIVGYFSKEKNPSKNNNLSCLLVLPMVQKMGYGRLLIDMSYELSRLEHRVGHPEHPLSDLGILAYRGYWRSSILCYLRTNATERINLKEMCLATRITQLDLINQMMLDNIVVQKNGVYSLKLGKRALKYPLSMSRRRAVDRDKIVWRAKPENPPLDPTRINTYV